MEYEELLDLAKSQNIKVHEKYDFSGTRIKGLYCDGNIALSKDLHTEAEKKCVLAEELGHYETAVGDITNQSLTSNRKQELRGRLIAYNKMVGLMGFIDAYQHHCHNLHEMAEYLDVTDAFLSETIDCYRAKYGNYAKLDNYVVYFEPNIGVLELI